MQVGFSELDYRASEGNGGVRVVVQKRNQNFGTLVLNVTTLSFRETPRSPGADTLDLPDPAERKCE